MSVNNPKGYRCRPPEDESALFDACSRANSEDEVADCLRALFVPGEITLEVFYNADAYRKAHLKKESSPNSVEHREGLDNELGMVRWTADYLNCLRALAGRPNVAPETLDSIAVIVSTMIRVSVSSMTTADWGQRGLITSLNGALAVIAARDMLPRSSLEIVLSSVISALNGEADGAASALFAPTRGLDDVIDALLENPSVEAEDIESLIVATWPLDTFDAGESVIESLTELTGYFAFQRLWEEGYRRVDVLAALAESSSQAARYFAARNTVTPVHVLCWLVAPESGSHEDVRAAVAANDMVPLSVAASLLDDDSPRVKAHALMRIAREQTPDAAMVAKCLPVDLVPLLPTGGGRTVGTPYGWDREPWMRSGGPLMLQAAASVVTPEVLSEWAVSSNPDDRTRASAFIVASIG